MANKKEDVHAVSSSEVNNLKELAPRTYTLQEVGPEIRHKPLRSRGAVPLALVLVCLALVALLSFVLYLNVTKQDTPRFEYFVSNDEQMFVESLEKSNFVNNQIFSLGSNYIASQSRNNTEENKDIISSLKDQFSIQKMFTDALKGNGLINTLTTINKGESIGITIVLADQLADVLKIKAPEHDNGRDVRLAIYNEQVSSDELQTKLDSLVKDQAILSGKERLEDFSVSEPQKPGEQCFQGTTRDGNAWRIVVREGAENTKVIFIMSNVVDTIVWLEDKI